MSTRQRTRPQASSDLPPKREGKAIRHDVSKPFQNISLSRFVHLITIFALLFTAFYTYRIVQWKGEAGGWWNLALGRRPPQINTNSQARPDMGTSVWKMGMGSGSGTKQDVALESHVHAIASILGMQPTDLASALSDAIHQHVAPKTLSSLSSSISSSASSVGSSAPVAKSLFGGNGAKSNADLNRESHSEGVADKAGTVAKAVDALVGLDEPIMAD